MTTANHSRATLDDVIALISNAELTGRKKQDLRSAVKTVAKLLGAEPASIAAEPALLRRRLEQISPAAHSISPGRWNNIRSLLGKALTLARPMLPGRSHEPLLPEWEPLTAALPFERRVRLLPLLRFLSARSIAPTRVKLADLEAYREAIVSDRLRKSPEKTWDSLIWAWNACRREVEGWPDIEIPREIRREIFVLPWSDFPPSLKTDVDAFLLRLSGADLSEKGPPRPARPATLKTRAYQLRVSASALVHKGVPRDEVRALADLVTLDHYKLVMRFLLDRHDGQPTPQVAQIATFLNSVARHWVEVDDVALMQLQKLASRLSSGRRGLTAKNRERLRPFEDPQTVAAFLALPERIRRQVEKDSRATKSKAIDAQMAAAIAILQATPIRLGNLAAIDLRRNLIARGKRVYLVFGESDTKNAEPIDFELPATTVDVVAWYIREYRPHLVRHETDALFPGKGNGAKSAYGFGTQIKAAVFRYSGLVVNAHLFRHAGAKIFLDQRPGEYEVMRQVLRHRSIQTTTSFYAGAETRSAGQHYAAVIDQLRADGSWPRRGDSAAALGATLPKRGHS
jgi:integrase